MVQYETFILGLILTLPIFIIFYYLLYKEEYEIKRNPRSLEDLAKSFWYDIYEYKLNGKIKLFKWVQLINYLLYVNLAKRLNYEEIPEKINIKIFKNEDYKKIKKLIKMINLFINKSPRILNYEKYFYKILLRYKELVEKK
jgi:glycosyltransferase involved in cell wall biosynthesis